MKKNNLVVLSILVLLSVISCKNFMNGDSFLTSLEQSVEYQQAPFAGILLTCDAKACKSMVPEAGKIEDKKAGDSFELQFEETEEYYFEKWIAEPEECVEFEDATSKKTKVTVVNADSPITIKPVCHTRKVLTINFVGENGSTYPFETKKYLSGEIFDISFSESAGFAFVNWSYSVVSGEQNPLTIASVGNIQTSVKVGELTKDSEITITAHSAKRPDVISSAPGKNATGVPLNSIITVYFDNEMDESSIYYSNKELYELGVTDSEGNLTGNYIKLTDTERENKCYGYQLKGDDNSIVFKNITIYNRDDSTQNYLKYYKAPRFDSSHKKLEIPTNENICLPATKNILVAISSQMGTMVGEKLVHMEKDLIWYYFTKNEEDANPPTMEVFATAMLDASSNLLPTDSNQILSNFNYFDYQKSIYLNGNEKISFSGKMSDSQSGIAYLSWTLNKLQLVNNELERIPVQKGYISDFIYTGAVASFYSDVNYNSGEVDISSILSSSKETVGMYEISVFVSDNCGNKSEKQNFYFYYDKYVSPVVQLSETREADDCATVSWKYPNESDLERIEIYYDNKEKKDVFLDQTSVVIDNLVTDHKYEYKAVLFDKFGNSSFAVFVDNEPPEKKSLVIRHEVKSKNTIKVILERPIKEVCKYSVIKFSETGYILENSTNNIIQDDFITLKNTNNVNNRFNTSFTIEDYDYSGNKSESIYEIKAEPGLDYYYYRDKFWSKDKIEGKDSDLLGQICYIGGNSLLGDDVRIIESSNYKTQEGQEGIEDFYIANMTLIKNNKEKYRTISLKMAYNGRNNYDIMRKQYPELMESEEDRDSKHQLIWPYLEELNKNIDIDNQKYFVWYVPSYVEMEYLITSRGKKGYGLNPYVNTDVKFITSSFGRSVSTVFLQISPFFIQKISGEITKSSNPDTAPAKVRLMAQVPLE